MKIDFEKLKNNSFKNLFLPKKEVDIDDSGFWAFIDKFGDGYYFNDSLHLYGLSRTKGRIVSHKNGDIPREV